MSVTSTTTRHAVSVLGPVAGDELGFVLPHEHLTIDTSDIQVDEGEYPKTVPVTAPVLGQVRRWPRSIIDNVVLDRDDEVIADLHRYRTAGGRSLVDLTPIGMGRDFSRYRAIAQPSDVTVIASTGYYLAYDHRGRVAGRSVESLAAEMVEELLVGDGRSRCGAIGEIGISADPVPDELLVLRAALEASRSTGAPVWVHVTSLRPVNAVLDVVAEHADDPRRVALCHMDYTLQDLTVHRRALAMGVNVEFDLFGFPGWTANWYLDMPTDTQRVRTLLQPADEGAHEQLLVSHDVCMKMQLSNWGGFGYAHLPAAVAPIFAQLSDSDDLLQQCAVANTRRLLCWAE